MLYSVVQRDARAGETVGEVDFEHASAKITLLARSAQLIQEGSKLTFSLDSVHAAYPITAKMALTKVAGVSKIDVKFDRREARMTSDDAKANVETLTRATKDAGYPSTVVGAPN